MEENFSIRLQRAMNIRNMKASELSEKANIPKSAISQYLSGLYEAKQKSIYKLAKVLNVNEGWLMGYDVPMERNSNIIQGSFNMSTIIKSNYGESSLELLDNYNKLNNLGKHTADVYVKDLTEIPKYTEKNESQDA